MNIDATLLELLRCPVDGKQLREASADELQRLNAAIAAKQLRTQSGGMIDQPLDSALITIDGERGHAIRNGIPTLIPGESFSITDKPPVNDG